MVRIYCLHKYKVVYIINQIIPYFFSKKKHGYKERQKTDRRAVLNDYFCNFEVLFRVLILNPNAEYLKV